MSVSRMPPRSQRPARPTTKFLEFSSYENGRVRYLRFDVNALADFEQETGMGFAQLMKQRAVFASARAMLWAGLKHEDRALSIEDVGILLSDYLTDETVAKDEHTIDTILMVAIEAAVEQGALGRREPPPQPENVNDARTLPNAPVLDAEVVQQSDPTTTEHTTEQTTEQS